MLKARQDIIQYETKSRELLKQRSEVINVLAIIFNEMPESFILENQKLPTTNIPIVQLQLPISILSNRPDLRAAELRLRKCLASVDASQAAAYPSFTLNGKISTSGEKLSTILSDPTALLGIGISLPFLNWNATQVAIKVSQKEYEEAVINFKKILFKAIIDSESAIYDYEQCSVEEKSLKNMLVLASELTQLLFVKYETGLIDVQNFLDSQSKQREIQEKILKNKLDRLNNLMRLYQLIPPDNLYEHLSTGVDLKE